MMSITPRDCINYIKLPSDLPLHGTNHNKRQEAFSTQSGIKSQFAINCAPLSPDGGIKPKLASSFDTPLPSDEIQTQKIDFAPAQHEKDAILCSPIQMMCALNILKLLP